MKIRLLSLLLALCATASLEAQPVCSPDPIAILLGVPGLWPNPQLGPLPDGNVNQPYSESITVIVPADTSIDTGQFGLPLGVITVSINSLEITGVSGLPAGMSSACDNANCTWAGNSNGCFKLSGTPTVAGGYTVSCSTSINVNLPTFGPFSTPAAPISYDLTILGPTGIADLQTMGYTLDAPRPNPSSGTSRIEFGLPVDGEIALELCDMQGRVVSREVVQARAGSNSHTLNLETLAPGIYLCSLIAEGQRLSTKLVVE
jgi:hypothetical protein